MNFEEGHHDEDDEAEWTIAIADDDLELDHVDHARVVSRGSSRLLVRRLQLRDVQFQLSHPCRGLTRRD